MRLIIIDDAPAIFLIFKELFENLGFTIVGSASSTEDAKNLIKTVQADVILLDIMLTEDGYEGIDILSESKEHTSADIFMVTSVTVPEIMETCYALGAFFYVSKSVIINNPEIVRIMIENRDQQDVLTNRFRKMGIEKILSTLANREIEALKMKEIGFQNEQIAKEMHVEKSSVKKMLSRAYAKIKQDSTGKFIKKLFTIF